MIPIIESGFMNLILFKDDNSEEMENYCRLLDIKEQYGFMIHMQFGDPGGGDKLENPIGSSVKLQGYIMKIREMMKDIFEKAVVSSVMGNKILLFLPWRRESMEYEERLQVIDAARSLIQKLKKQIGLKPRIGIGSIHTIPLLHESLREAQRAFRMGGGSVVHSQDAQSGEILEENYPLETEKKLFADIREGREEKSREEAELLFDWLAVNYAGHDRDAQTKILEIVMAAEREASLQGGVSYGMSHRKDYLDTVAFSRSYEELRGWFLRRISDICQNIMQSCRTQNNEMVQKAKSYISLHFEKDISLEDVARHVDISPYYFSRLFKEEEGTNFIEYVTALRIGRAKELLASQEKSIKEVCLSIGYSDPNYFSRLFKKVTGCTPTEYREGL